MLEIGVALGVAAKELLALYSSYKTSDAIQKQQSFHEWLTYDQAKKVRADIGEVDFKLLKLVAEDQKISGFLTTLLEGSEARDEKMDDISKRLDELLGKSTVSLEAHQEILKASRERSRETLREVIADNRSDAELRTREIVRLELEIASITEKLSHSESSLEQANNAREAAASELLALQSSLPESEFEQAFFSLRNGESDKAFEAFERIANINSDLSFRAACVAANLAENEGRLIEAVGLYDKAHGMCPEDMRLAVECANNHVALGNFRKASRTVIAALEANGYHDIELLEPENFGPHDYGAILNLLGASETGQGNTASAIKLYTTALRVKDLLNPRARLQLLLGRADAYNLAEQANLAESDYRAAAREHLLVGDSILAATILNNAADNLMQLDEFGIAESLYREANSKLVGDDVTTKVHKAICEGNIGNCLARNGKVRDGMKFMQASLEFFRKNPDASDQRQSILLLNLSDVSRTREQYVMAIAFAEEARDIAENQFGKLHIDTVTALSRLAQCHFESGDAVEAVSLYEDAFDRMSTRTITRSSTVTDIAVGYSRALEKCCEQGFKNDHTDSTQVLKLSLFALAKTPQSLSNGSTAMIRNELSRVISKTDPDSALKELDISIRELSQSPLLSTSQRLKNWMAIAYSNKAIYYIDRENWHKALEQIDKSLELWKSIGFNYVHDLVVGMCHKSYIFFRMERFDDGKAVSQQAHVIIRQINSFDSELAARIAKSVKELIDPLLREASMP